MENQNDNKNLTEFIVDEIKPIEGFEKVEIKKKKKNPYLKFIYYFTIVIVSTGLALFLSLKDNFESVINSIKNINLWYVLLIIGMVIVCYLLEGLILLLFGRLYTRKYHYPNGLASSVVGSFYDSVTPGATGGQLMQIMTIKKQGINISNATSIVVMYVIIKQFAMIVIQLLGVIFKYPLLISIGEFHISILNHDLDLPALPLTLIGFAYNLVFTLGIILLSYWKGFHHFVCNIVISFLAKIKIIKKPDELRENVRVSVENFRIELKRLFSNRAVFIFTFIVCFIIITLKYSIPFIAGVALDGFGINEISGLPTTGQVDVTSFFDSVFLCAYHQMTSSLIPIPGSAGISEIIFNIIFENYFINPSITTAAQIIWRSATYYLVLLVTGIFTALYTSSPEKESFNNISRNTLLTIQYETLIDRKKGIILKSGSAYDFSDFDEELHKDIEKTKRKIHTKVKENKAKKAKKITKNNKKEVKQPIDNHDDWENIEI